MTVEQTNKSYIPALDGLRGIAILFVVLYHNFGFIKQTSFGWLGVDLFFVLSGYLITSILLKTVGEPGYLKNFFMKRVLRIFPLYFLCLVVFLIIFRIFGWYANELSYYHENQWWLWTYLQNWLYAFTLKDGSAMLVHLWSLAVEEQFYLIWPFVILIVKKPKTLFFIMLGVLIFVIAARSVLWLYHFEDFNYTLIYTFTRIDGICIGSMIALTMSFRPNFIGKNMAIIVVILAALNFLFYFLNQIDTNSHPYFAFIGFTTFCGMFGLLLHELVTNKNTILSKVFSIKPLRFMGKISYGFYVYHWPIFMMTQGYFFIFFKDNLNFQHYYSGIAASTLSTLIAFIISVISYYTFEKYFLRMKTKFN